MTPSKMPSAVARSPSSPSPRGAKERPTPAQDTPPAPEADLIARHRSGAAARMAGIPVSTLRIWEQRYRVVGPHLTEAGHRLYTGHDVQRLLLLKQLATAGHAIGSIAPLRLSELQALARSRGLDAAPQERPPAPVRQFLASSAPQPPSVVVVGRGLAQRLLSGVMRQPGVTGRVSLVAVHGDLYEAQAQGAALPVALLLVHLASLHAEAVERVLAVARRLKAVQSCVLYGYGPEHVAGALRAAGVIVRRESITDHELGVLLTTAPLAAGSTAGAALAAEQGVPGAALQPPLQPPPRRRFADEALIELAAVSATIACECPRHVAELVMQLSGFEQYSAECVNRNPADSALHGYLHQVAGTARALFETALERVALAEGIALSPASGRG